MRPGLLFVRALVVVTAAALAVPIAPALVWALVLSLAAILAAFVVEASALRRVTITAERREAIALSLDEEQTIALHLRTDSDRAVRLTIRQVWPALVEAAGSQRTGLCRPGEVLPLEFPVRGVARGRETLPAPWVAATFWGWAERTLPAGNEETLSVLPNLAAVRRLHGQLNQYALRGFGSRISPKLGKGREFDRLRDYVRGDDFRDIAWKASARHRRFIVREFRLDRSQDVLVCIDRGHRMAARVAHVTRLDHAVNAAVLLAYICNRMEDRVGVLSFADRADQGLGQGRGGSHLKQLTAYTTGVQASFVHTDYLALAAQLRRRVRTRSLILMLTVLPELDEQGDLVRAVEMLAPQHLPLVMVLSDPDLEAEARFLPVTSSELCRTLVARDLVHGREQLVRELRRRGALVVKSSPADVGLASVNAYIDVKRRQLL